MMMMTKSTNVDVLDYTVQHRGYASITLVLTMPLKLNVSNVLPRVVIKDSKNDSMPMSMFLRLKVSKV